MFWQTLTAGVITYTQPRAFLEPSVFEDQERTRTLPPELLELPVDVAPETSLEFVVHDGKVLRVEW